MTTELLNRPRDPIALAFYATVSGDNSGGRGMLSIVANQVFAEIVEISRSDGPPPKRREETEKRIVLLKIDLKSARLEPGVSDDLENNLARHLREALNNLELPGEQRSVFVAALEALTAS